MIVAPEHGRSFPQGKSRDIMTLQDELDHKDQWTKLSQQELDEVLDKHEKFVNKQRDGERAQLGMHDLSYLDMAGRNLSRAELTGGIPNYCNLEGAVMKNMDMEGADFWETDLRYADLSGSLLIDADLTDADLRGTNLNDTDIRGTKGVPKKFEEDEAD